MTWSRLFPPGLAKLCGQQQGDLDLVVAGMCRGSELRSTVGRALRSKRVRRTVHSNWWALVRHGGENRGGFVGGTVRVLARSLR